MKKILAMTLTLTLILSLCVTALATTINSANGSQDIDMTVNYQEPEAAVVYTVDIQWEEMVFSLERTSAKVWNAESHQYEYVNNTAQFAQGEDGSRTITVTNHSNAAIGAKLTVLTDEGWEAALTNADFTCAAVADKGTATTGTATVQLNAWPEIIQDGANFGTLTITITGK